MDKVSRNDPLCKTKPIIPICSRQNEEDKQTFAGENTTGNYIWSRDLSEELIFSVEGKRYKTILY